MERNLNQDKTNFFLTLIVLLLPLWAVVIIDRENFLRQQPIICQEKLTARMNFNLEILDYYVKYHCFRDKICSREAALIFMPTNWPQLYQQGFAWLNEAGKANELKKCTQ